MVAADARVVRWYPAGWRAFAAVLFAISRISLPWILWRVWSAVDPPITPPLLAEMLLVVWALPGAAAWLIGRAFTAVAAVSPDGVELARSGRRILLRRADVATARPWWVPLPEPGFGLRFTDDTAAPFAVAARDPTPLLAALAPPALRHPLMVWAAARSSAPRWPYYARRYLLFPLFPAAVLFNTHQQIAYGGLLGQYYLMGLGAWLTTAAIYWATLCAYLLLYASAWRGLAEVTSLLAAWLAPARAAAVRSVAERIDQLAFYVGVPVLLALRYLA